MLLLSIRDLNLSNSRAPIEVVDVLHGPKFPLMRRNYRGDTPILRWTVVAGGGC
jgi:hypothetical protein